MFNLHGGKRESILHRTMKGKSELVYYCVRYTHKHQLFYLADLLSKFAYKR